MFQRMVWIVLLGLFTTAQAAEVVNVTLSLGVSDAMEPIEPTDHFSTKAPVLHALAELTDVRGPTDIEGSWIAVDAIETPNYVIDAVVVSVNTGATHAHFSLSKPNSDWPAGNYELAIAVNGTPVGKAPFVISATAAAPATSASSQLATPPFASPMQSAAAAQGTMAAAPAQTIVGSWQCQMSHNGTVVGSAGVMTFDANNRVTFAQSNFLYQLVSANQLTLQDQYNRYDYEYQLAGNTLKMRYSDGSVFDCQRSQQMAGGAMGQQQAQGGAMGQQGQGSSNWQMRGTFCSYSGSSSYSSTGYLSFDGQGRWSQSSESSFSNQHGSGYGQSGSTGGSYQVQGKYVQYRTDAGEQGTAEVHMQQSSGQITEIMVGRQLYAMGMCG